MNEIEHAFPLPEVEKHKLDEIEQEIKGRPVMKRLRDFARANTWHAVAFSVVAGLFCGLALGRRN